MRRDILRPPFLFDRPGGRFGLSLSDYVVFTTGAPQTTDDFVPTRFRKLCSIRDLDAFLATDNFVAAGKALEITHDLRKAAARAGKSFAISSAVLTAAQTAPRWKTPF